METDFDELQHANLEASLFDEPVYQFTHLKKSINAQHIDNKLTATDDTTPIIFRIPKNAGVYINLLKTYLLVTWNIVTVENEVEKAIAADTKVAAVNLISSSMFKDVVLYLNNTKIEGDNSHYPWKAYLLNLLIGNDISKTFDLPLCGWTKDIAGEFDLATNKGFIARQLWSASSNTVETISRIFLDLCLQHRLITDQCDIELRFHRASHNFCLLSFEGAAKVYKLNIKSVDLFVHTVNMAPGVVEGHLAGVIERPMSYNYNGYRIIHHVIPKETTNIEISDCAKGVFPKMIFAGLISASAYNGNIGLSPFNFKHYKSKSIGLQCNGNYIPYHPTKTDFAKGMTAKAQWDLACCLDKEGVVQDTIAISGADFVGGSTIYGFDLTPDGIISGHSQPAKLSNIQYSQELTEALPEAAILLLFCVYQTFIKVNKDFNILLDPSQASS